MPQSVIVWDIETVPDLQSYARVHGLPSESEEVIREAMGSKFPKLPYHSIVCIGMVVAERVDGIWQVRTVGAPHVGERSEREIIADFLEDIAELEPQLVTYNGSGFDLPVLRYRAMLHQLEAPGLFARPYFNRYTEDALDLCDALSSFGTSTKMKLDEVSKFLGLDGKPDGVDGSQVDAYFRAGRIKEIAEYCVSDVVNTYRLWLRWQLFRGALTVDQLALSENSLQNRSPDHRWQSPMARSKISIS